MTSEPTTAAPRRVTLIADELLGYVRTGGLGTATTHLALALGHMGHDVELLYVGAPPEAEMDAAWRGLYDDAGVAVRVLERTTRSVQPPFFARMLDVERALRADPPDVVVVQDLAAPAYPALRLRQLGRAFERTLFVVYCHGGRRWITDTARKVRVLPGAHAVTVLEQASVEIADAVVSPSAYLLDWMRHQGWKLPASSRVIPYVPRSLATGESPPAAAASGGRVERIAFFGRLEERKGLQPFAAALNALPPSVLSQVELDFVGRATPAWPLERIAALLSPETRDALRGMSFHTELDQPEALARLARPGTLAVMPSLGETFSNAVYECLERRIPFLASDAGAPPELVAPEDRGRVLCAASADGLAAALRRTLEDEQGLRPARLAFDPRDTLTGWEEMLQAPAERAAAPAADGEWVTAFGGEDAREQLLRSQAASGADVVTCGIRLPSGEERHFLGDPGALGLLSNAYGTAAVIRRSLLPDGGLPDATGESDAAWPLLARLSLEGAKVVSIPEALVEQSRLPGTVDTDTVAALAVALEFERALPRHARGLARLAAGLAAEASQAPPRPARRRLPPRVPSRLRRR